MADTPRKIMSAAAEGILAAILIAERSVKKEAVLQAHVDTGALLKSIVHEVSYDSTQAEGIVFAADYAVFVNVGVAADKVRYPIRVMIAWWKRKGLPTKEAIRAAWATKKKHEKVGIPTIESRRFSQTGKRLGFVQSGLERVAHEIQVVFESRMIENALVIFDDSLVFDDYEVVM